MGVGLVEPIGTVFCLLDYNPRIKAINGRLFPFGFVRLLWNKKGIKRMRAISTNVVPEYQAWGVGLVLMAGAGAAGAGLGDEGGGVLLGAGERTTSRSGRSSGAGPLVTKKYRMYQDDPPKAGG
jgi:hypothetical protein